MKTWEVYKMLLENPDAKFKRLSHGDIAHLNDKGQLVTTESGNRVGYLIPLVNQEWELVRESVDFMTAVKALSEGKSIRCEFDVDDEDNTTFYKPGIDACQPMRDQSGIGISPDEILTGLWYIED